MAAAGFTTSVDEPIKFDRTMLINIDGAKDKYETIKTLIRDHPTINPQTKQCVSYAMYYLFHNLRINTDQPDIKPLFDQLDEIRRILSPFLALNDEELKTALKSISTFIQFINSQEKYYDNPLLITRGDKMSSFISEFLRYIDGCISVDRRQFLQTQLIFNETVSMPKQDPTLLSNSFSDELSASLSSELSAAASADVPDEKENNADLEEYEFVPNPLLSPNPVNGVGMVEIARRRLTSLPGIARNVGGAASNSVGQLVTTTRQKVSDVKQGIQNSAAFASGTVRTAGDLFNAIGESTLNKINSWESWWNSGKRKHNRKSKHAKKQQMGKRNKSHKKQAKRKSHKKININIKVKKT